MAHVPARLPQAEADLADWSVYADALLEHGDPRGGVLALELALPAGAALHEVAPVMNRWRTFCPQPHDRAIKIGWTLGYARALAVRGANTPNVVALPQPIAAPTFAAVSHLLRQPLCRLLESIELDVRGPDTTPAIEVLLRDLPASCTRIVIHAPLAPFAAIASVFDVIPAHVTHLAFGEGLLVPREHAHALAARFDVELGRLYTLDASWVHAGCRFGDAGLIAARSTAVTVLDRPSLLELQRSHGIVMIRAQLERRLPEVHGLRGPPREGSTDATLVRRPARWTLGGDRGIQLNGTDVPPGAQVTIEDGSTITIDGHDRLFVAHDLDARYRELVSRRREA